MPKHSFKINMISINKISLLIFSLFIILNTTVGQPLVGAHLGINMSSLSGDKNNDEVMNRIGISPYISLDFHINYLISLETGVSYSMQGMQRTRVDKEGLAVTTTKTNYNIDYLVVPVYLKENFTSFYAKIGPYGAYPINAIEKWHKTVSTSGVVEETNDTNPEFQSSITPFDIGVSIGFGYIHYLSNKKRRRSYRRRRTTSV
ncbi:MAG: hypothetical protein DRJ10_12995, partial [Bacteroidetes bacterium]